VVISLRHWIQSLATLIAPLIVASVVAAIWGLIPSLIVFAIWVSATVVTERRTLSFFSEWLNDPVPDRLPSTLGTWDKVFRSFFKLQKTQRITEAAQARTLDRFQQGARALPDAVILLDSKNRILWCNPKSEEFFKIALERDRGVQVDYLIRQTNFRQFLSTSSTASLILEIQHERGQRLVSIQTIPFGQNQRLLLAQDVTDREKLDTTRRDFIANVSHELRTPLTVIQGYLETFEDDPTEDPELLSRGIELMSNQSQRMNRLVEDLLTLSRLETSDTTKDEFVDIPNMLDDIAAEADALSKAEHRVVTEVDHDLKLMGAEDEIRSALMNLVSNAIRYSPDGGVITLRWNASSGRPIFTCSDQGVGIEQKHIDRLTERFYRVDKSRSRETGGTGLGLAIVKHVLTRHGAQLRVTSEPEEGSQFAIEFPAARMVREPN
jgi:two-component system phosphate regulon sensor histidine kinase PhoR